MRHKYTHTSHACAAYMWRWPVLTRHTHAQRTHDATSHACAAYTWRRPVLTHHMHAQRTCDADLFSHVTRIRSVHVTLTCSLCFQESLKISYNQPESLTQTLEYCCSGHLRCHLVSSCHFITATWTSNLKLLTLQRSAANKRYHRAWWDWCFCLEAESADETM